MTCCTTALLYLGQRRFRLGQPEGHLHGAVELDGGRQLGAGLLPLAAPGIQGAEAMVAVGLERAHTERLGQGECLPVPRLTLGYFRRVGLGMDGAQLVKRERLVPALPVLPGQGERLARCCMASSTPPAMRQTALSCAT